MGFKKIDADYIRKTIPELDDASDETLSYVIRASYCLYMSGLNSGRKWLSLEGPQYRDGIRPVLEIIDERGVSNIEEFVRNNKQGILSKAHALAIEQIECSGPGCWNPEVGSVYGIPKPVRKASKP